MNRFLATAALCVAGLAPALAAPVVQDSARGQPIQVVGEAISVQVAQRERPRKVRRAPPARVLADQEHLRIPNTRVIPPSAGGAGTTYSDRIVGCTHGAGVAGISGMDRGPAIHNCAFGH